MAGWWTGRPVRERRGWAYWLRGRVVRLSAHESGEEETPRGLGKCEECLPLNVVLKGNDGKLYENRKDGWHKLN